MNNSETYANPETQDTDPMLAEAWAAAPTTEQLVSTLIFNRQKDKPAKAFPGIIFHDFQESRGWDAVKFQGQLAKFGAATLKELLLGNPIILPDETRAELIALDRQIKQVWSQFDDYSLARAEQVWRSQRTAAGKLGDDGRLVSTAISSLEDLKGEYLTKQSALHDVLRPLIERAKGLLTPYFAVAFRALSKEAAYLEMGERERADLYNIIFMPSYLLRCGWALLIRLDGASLAGEIFVEKMVLALGIGFEL